MCVYWEVILASEEGIMTYIMLVNLYSPIHYHLLSFISGDLNRYVNLNVLNIVEKNN